MIHMDQFIGDRRNLIYYGVTALVAVFTYWFALGSQHIPTSTDELAYVHITRVTAASGRLLPLRSEIPALRNLKPPPLFWQGIASTNWGKKWSLWQLRYPNVVYTLLTAFLVYLIGRKLSGEITAGLIAALVFLAFFSTFRYGRTFLTDAPLTFWLFIPFFVLLYWQPASFESRILIPLVLAIAVGIGVFYKSLVLLVPVLGSLGWWYWRKREYQASKFIARDAWKLAVIGSIALTIFSVWFIFDPEPGAIWQDFVLRENVGKIKTPGGGYIATLLWSKDGVWKMFLAYPANSGLLALAVLALFYFAWKHRSSLTESEKLLWICAITYFVVFIFPSHRSERYLLPAMPALAILMALSWDRFQPMVLRTTVIIAGVIIAGLIYGSICLQAGVASDKLYPLWYWIGVGAAEALVLASLFVASLLRPGMLMTVFLVYLCFSGFMAPLDGALGTYPADVRQAVRGRELRVPSRFNGREEGYRFQLPGADIRPYNYESHATTTDLSAKYPLVIVRLPLKNDEPIVGKVLARRLELRSNHTLRQMIEMATGKLADYLFVQELLIESVETSHAADR